MDLDSSATNSTSSSETLVKSGWTFNFDTALKESLTCKPIKKQAEKLANKGNTNGAKKSTKLSGKFVVKSNALNKGFAIHNAEPTQMLSIDNIGYS